MNSPERLLARIIIGCIVVIVYSLCTVQHAEHKVLSLKNHSIPIIESKSSVKHHNINSHKTRDNLPNAKVSASPGHWIYHRKKVNFIHPAIGLHQSTNQRPEVKSQHYWPKKYWDDNFHSSYTVSKPVKPTRFGIFALERIPFGTILSIEDPIFSSLSFTKQPPKLWNTVSFIDRIVKDQIKKDPEFQRVWESLPVQTVQQKPLVKMWRSAVNNYVRFATHKMFAHKRPWALYSVIGRLGFNLPQNAMVVIGDNDKALLISTKTIEKGEEIVTDHFGDWLNPQLLKPQNLNARKLRAGELGFDLNEKWLAWLKRLRDESLSADQKQQMLLKLYPNGLIGKDANQTFRAISGCTVVKWRDCYIKNLLRKIIGSGAIFDEIDAEYFNNNIKQMASGQGVNNDMSFGGKQRT